MMVTPKNILIIHDDRTGHLNPCLGVAEILQTKLSYSEVTKFKTPVDLPKPLISFFKRVSNFPIIFKFLVNLVFKNIPVDAKNTSVIICSGMPNLIYAVYIAKKFNIPLIYVGGLRKFNPLLIDWVITVDYEKNVSNQINIPLGVTLSKFSNIANQPSNKEACLLIGGPTEEYPFTPYNYEILIQQFIQFVKNKKITGNVVLSRRTPKLTMKCLNMIKKNKISLIGVEDPISIIDIMKLSDYIFITEDSATMFSEAMQTKRAIISICLDMNYKNKFIKNLAEKKFLQQRLFNDLTDIEYLQSPFSRSDIEQPILDQLSIDLRL